MYRFIGKRTDAPSTADQFIGGQLDRPWMRYVIKALPRGLILQHGPLMWETTGSGVTQLDPANPGEIVRTVL